MPRPGLERGRVVAPARELSCSTSNGLGPAADVESKAEQLRAYNIISCCALRSGTLVIYAIDSGATFERRRKPSCPNRLAVRAPSFIFGEGDPLGGESSGIHLDGYPWFSRSSEPGSSAGSSGMIGTEVERGRLGSGFCKSAGLLQAVGERSKSSKAACRLDVALSRPR